VSLPRVDISPETLIPDLLGAFPEVRSVLNRYGMRAYMGVQGPPEPLRCFARLHGVDERRLLAELNHLVSGDAAAPAAPDRLRVVAGLPRLLMRRIRGVRRLGHAWPALAAADHCLGDVLDPARAAPCCRAARACADV
jgi:hypothetical protein